MKSFVEFLEDKMNNLDLRVSVLVSEAKGEILVPTVLAIAEDLGFSITKRQAKAAIKKAMKGYGY